MHHPGLSRNQFQQHLKCSSFTWNSSREAFQATITAGKITGKTTFRISISVAAKKKATDHHNMTHSYMAVRYLSSSDCVRLSHIGKSQVTHPDKASVLIWMSLNWCKPFPVFIQSFWATTQAFLGEPVRNAVAFKCRACSPGARWGDASRQGTPEENPSLSPLSH